MTTVATEEFCLGGDAYVTVPEFSTYTAGPVFADAHKHGSGKDDSQAAANPRRMFRIIRCLQYKQRRRRQ